MRIFSISGWLAVPINPDKWSSTVLSVTSVGTAVRVATIGRYATMSSALGRAVGR